MTEIKEKLACSLTAETTDLIPFLPDLLQDFWALGSDPEVMTGLIDKHIPISEHTRILDLACGKGAVSIRIAHKLGVKVKGIDILPAFIEFAVRKAQEFHVDDLCEFVIGDINEAVRTEKDYDCVIFGAAGGVLGDPAKTLNQLKATIKPGGYILIDECYLPDNFRREDVRFNHSVYLTEQEWMDLFTETGLRLIGTDVSDDSDYRSGDDFGNLDSSAGMAAIIARANELIALYPDKRAMFEGYVRSQQNEYDDIDSILVGVTWILQKTPKMKIYKNPNCKKIRGSHILEVRCAYCKCFIANYQKVGESNFVKMYNDRIINGSIDFSQYHGALFCPSCGKQIATRYITRMDKKEAYRFVPSAFHKKKVHHI